MKTQTKNLLLWLAAIAIFWLIMTAVHYLRPGRHGSEWVEYDANTDFTWTTEDSEERELK